MDREPETQSDRALLAAYRGGDHDAFRALVGRHVDMVWSSARRQLRDAALAEDAAQVVFAVLAKKATALSDKVLLPGWLFNTTRLVCANQLRRDRRRARHEREAAAMAEQLQRSQQPDASWERLSPLLEEGIARLSGSEREALLLRYFQGRSLRETGEALGISEDSAAQRVSRAVRRLRDFFAGRGVVAGAAAVATMLAANAVHAAPVGLAATAGASALASLGGSTPIAVLAQQALKAAWWGKAKAAVSAAAAACIVAGAGSILFFQLRPGNTGTLVDRKVAPVTQPAVMTGPGAPATKPVVTRRVGFPVSLPGSVSGSPAIADVDGDGQLEIIVPTIGRSDLPGHRVERLLHAYRADGTPLPGWPAVIMDAGTRNRERTTIGVAADYWASSPAVLDWDGDGKDDVAIMNRLGVIHVTGGPDGPIVKRLTGRGDAWACVPLVDVNRDGRIDLVAGWELSSIDGSAVPGFPASRIFPGGFAPAVGDADGDGHVEIYHPYFADAGMIGGYDRFGRELPGWPQRIIGDSRFGPVLGDLDGDGRKEVAAADAGGHLLIWTWDGRPHPLTFPKGDLTAVFKENFHSRGARPTLADLDGDGKDEIIAFDGRTRTLHAWRNDGSGLGRLADGALIVIPDAIASTGVTVADLGGDGEMDLFVSTHWVRLKKDGTAGVINMAGQPTHTTTECTICDVDRDGIADVVFGTFDGALYRVSTGLRYDPAKVLWATAGGNARRTNTRLPPPFAHRKEPFAAATKGIPFTVVDAATSAPIPRARLTIQLAEGELVAETDARGEFDVPAAGQLSVTVSASAPGRATVTAVVEATTGWPERRTIALPKGAAVGGTVLHLNGSPVAGAAVFVSVRGPAGAGADRVDLHRVPAVTDTSGAWRIDGVPDAFEALWVRVERPGLVTDASKFAAGDSEAMRELRGGSFKCVLRASPLSREVRAER